MSAPAPRNPALRVKLPCENERDFFARYADAIAEKGLKVPTANLRPVGSRVRVVLEFRDGASVTGEAVVDAHVEGARPTMNVRLLRFDRPSPAGAGAPAVTPAPTPTPTSTPTRAAAPTPTRAASAAPRPETSFESLFEGGEEEPATPARDVVPAPQEAEALSIPPPEHTEELEPLYGEGAPEPTPVPAPQASARSGAAPPRLKGAPLPAATKRTVLAAVAAAAVLGIGVLAYVSLRRPAPAPAAAGAAPAAPAPDASAVAAHVASADRRMGEGHLTGPDGALDHLLAASALSPGDAGVRERLALLADTLERLGSRALERGDVAEAEVHLAAALRAAPGRQSIVEKLEALAKAPGKPGR